MSRQQKYENIGERIESRTVRAIVEQGPSDTDPNGSYTGKPMYEDEVPQQDADDL